MGVTPLSPACTQKVSGAKAPTVIVPLCAQGVSFQEGKICALSRQQEKKKNPRGAIGYGLDFPLPANNGADRCTYVCTLGEEVVRRQLPGLPSGDMSREKRQSYHCTLEPAKKRAHSQVLVLGFSQAPPSASCMPRPLIPWPLSPAACSTSTQTPSPPGSVLLA